MSGVGAFIQADRQERLDRKAAAKRVLDGRAAQRVAAREWVTQVGLLDANGQPCPWAIQAALRLKLSNDTVTRSVVLAAANKQKSAAFEWVGRASKEKVAA